MNVVIVHPYTQTIIDKDQIQVHINELDSIGKATCDSLHLADTMDYVMFEQRNIVLSRACEKLKINGIITVSGTEIHAVGNSIVNCEYNVEALNKALFMGRLSCGSINDTIEELKSMNINVVNAKISGLYFSIKGRRKING